jgi:hypothetical protein
MNGKSDKELRQDALQLAFVHLQAKFEHMARAAAALKPAESLGHDNYFNLSADYYPSDDEVLEYAKKYIDFINSVE